MSIKLADRSLHEPIGVVNDAQIRVGPHTYLIDLVILDVTIEPFCHIFLVNFFYVLLRLILIVEKKLSL